MKLEDLQIGDIVTYANGRKNYVNHPERYSKNYTNNLSNYGLGYEFNIVKVQRYKKILFFYVLCTIFKTKYTW